jgi:rhamnosyltransferase
MIYDDLLATQSMSTINDHLHFDCILSTGTLIKNGEGINKKIALVMYIYPDDLIEYCRIYAESIPETAYIFIVNTSLEVSEKCKSNFRDLKNKIEYRIQPNRGRDNTALLITCKDVIENFDYICFVHSKKSEHSYPIYGHDFRNHCFMSLLFNKIYVQNIISTLNSNERLGMLIPMIPVGFTYWTNMVDIWTVNKQNAIDFLRNKMNVNLIFDPYVLAPIGGMYWAKTAALHTLAEYDWTFEDFPKEPLKLADGLLTHCIERITPLLAQYDGYYIAHVAPDYYASSIINNLYYWVRYLILQSTMREKIFFALTAICVRHPKFRRTFSFLWNMYQHIKYPMRRDKR